MAQRKSNDSGTPTVKEMKEMYASTTGSRNELQFKAAQSALTQFIDPAKRTNKSIPTFSKSTLRSYLSSIGNNEKNLRDLSVYLYYRSHVYARLVNFYASMFDLRCRKVVPNYNIVKTNNDKKLLKGYNDTLTLLDTFNLHNNMTEVLIRCFREDTCFALFFHDETGAFFYELNPSYCRIDGRYMTGDYSFAVDMSQWRSSQKQLELEWLGSPLKEMFNEYQRTGEKWVHCDDKYAACFKFRTDDWESVIPPFITLFQSLLNLEELADVQAIADEQQIYKLIYMPMKTISSTKQSDDFMVSPDISVKYFQKMIEEALPDYVSAALVPGDELKTIDFKDNAAADTDRVEQAASTILNTSGGGMVLNTSKITTQAGFQAALKAETEFAISTLLPQINGFVNRILIGELGTSACRVEHLEVSVYTKDLFAESLLKSCQYSFANRLAYNTCLGFSERDTLAMAYLENNLLGLPDIMKFPLQSSYTQTAGTEDGFTNEIGQGAPAKDDSELSDEGSESRDQA